MSRVSTRTHSGHPEDIENPHHDRPDVPPPPAWLPRKPEPDPKHPYEDTRLEQLLDEGPPMSAVRLWRHLNRKGRWRNARGERNCGVWECTRTMARKTGLSESAVRTVALPWLRAHGWTARDRAVVDGQVVDMEWLTWFLPLDLSGHACHLGHRVKLEGNGLEVAGPGPAPRRPGRARKSPEGADECAHPTAPDCREKRIKTTDDVGSSSSGSAPPRGEGIGEPDPPAPPLDPAIVEAFDHEAASEAERGTLVGHVPGWIAQGFPVERITEVVREVICRQRVEKVYSAPKLAAKILANWRDEKKVTLRFARPRVKAGGPATRSVEDVAAEDAKARAKAEAGRIAEAGRLEGEAARKARWDALPEADREAIRARVRAENPGLDRWKNMLLPLCLAAMESAGGGA